MMLLGVCFFLGKRNLGFRIWIYKTKEDKLVFKILCFVFVKEQNFVLFFVFRIKICLRTRLRFQG